MTSNNLKTVLLAGTAAGALLALPQQAYAQSYTTGPGFYLSLEGRYMWNSGSTAKTFAYSDGDFTGANFEPYDTSKAAADRGFGGKAMLGYRFYNNWDIGFGLSGGWLKGKDKTHTYNYSRAPLELALAPNALTDHISTRLAYTTIDFEAGYNMPVGGQSNFRLFGGLRFAYFNQMAKGGIEHELFNAVYYDYSGKRKTTFAGVGPRIGANGTIGIGGSGLNLFGGLSGALLIGRYKDRHAFSYVGTNGSTRSFDYKEKKTKLVPNFAGEIGVGYNFSAGSGGTTVGLQLGYRGEAFMGAGTKGHIIAKDEKASGDYLMHGPFARLMVNFGAAKPMPAVVAPPPPPPPVSTVKSFLVFFDFDRSTITAEGLKTINDAVAAAKAGGSTRITLTGHTDRSGSEQYNIALSLRRGEAVKAAMISAGIPVSAIVVIGRGESQPLVPTADGVREPQNRRVEIVI